MVDFSRVGAFLGCFSAAALPDYADCAYSDRDHVDRDYADCDYAGCDHVDRDCADCDYADCAQTATM